MQFKEFWVNEQTSYINSTVMYYRFVHFVLITLPFNNYILKDWVFGLVYNSLLQFKSKILQLDVFF